MKTSAPKIAALRPTFGIGIAIGAAMIFASQATGSESAFGLVLGGGVGIALGLTRRSGAHKIAADGAVEQQREESRK